MTIRTIVTTAAMASAITFVAVGGCFAQDQPDPHSPPPSPHHSEDRYQAPIGHRQPRPQDLPRSVLRNEGTVQPWQRDFDRRLNICRDC
jgi:hypothetical protein